MILTAQPASRHAAPVAIGHCVTRLAVTPPIVITGTTTMMMMTHPLDTRLWYVFLSLEIKSRLLKTFN